MFPANVEADMRTLARNSGFLFLRFALCTLLLGLAADAQETKTGIHLPTDWRVGEKYRINVVRERIRADGTNVFTGTATVQFELKQRNDEGFVFAWTVGRTDMGRGVHSAYDLKDQASLADMLGEEELRLELRTNAMGQPAHLVNLDDIVARSRSKIDQAVRLAPSNVSKKAAREMKKYLEEQFRPEKLAEAGLRDAHFFYLACGTSFLREGETVNGDDVSGSIPAKISFGLTEIKQDVGEAAIAYKRIIDPTKLNAALANKFAENRREAARLGFCRDGCPNPESMPKYEIEERATYVMDLKTGWPNSVTYEREIRVGDKRDELDRTTLTRILAPPQ